MVNVVRGAKTSSKTKRKQPDFAVSINLSPFPHIPIPHQIYQSSTLLRRYYDRLNRVCGLDISVLQSQEGSGR